MRKDSGFEVTDKISVEFEGSDKIASVFEANAEEIKTQTLAETITMNSSANAKEWNINGEKVLIAINKI